MQPSTPGPLTDNVLQHQSVYKTLRANVAIGQAQTFDSTGQAATFTQDNGNGIMVRVGAIGNPHGLAQTWTAVNTPTTIVHNLGRVPIGYYIVRKSASCDIYDGTVANWTNANISLEITANADTTLYIF